MTFQWKDLRVFFGEVTATSARVYARLPAGALEKDESLTGQVFGPHCESSRTLPSVAPLKYLGSDPQPLAAAMVLDPSFWSPELPVRYQVQIERRREGRCLSTHQQWIGLRRFGAQGDSFFSDSRRTVLRSVKLEMCGAAESELWREQCLHQSPLDPADNLLVMAEQEGIALLPRLTVQPNTPWLPRLFQISQCAAAWLVELPTEAADVEQEQLRAAAGNLMLAIAVDAGLPFPSWADAAVITVGDDLARAHALAANLSSPILMRRDSSRRFSSPTDARRDCERLQRDLAPASFAGYLV